MYLAFGKMVDWVMVALGEGMVSTARRAERSVGRVNIDQ